MREDHLIVIAITTNSYGNVVAIDFVGHGQSPASLNPADYSTGSIVRDLETLFGSHRTERNVIIGHSYGTGSCATLQTTFLQ